MAWKNLKTRKQLTVTIDIKHSDFINAYSDKTGIPKSVLIDKGIEMLREKIEKGENLFE